MYKLFARIEKRISHTCVGGEIKPDQLSPVWYMIVWDGCSYYPLRIELVIGQGENVIVPLPNAVTDMLREHDDFSELICELDDDDFSIKFGERYVPMEFKDNGDTFFLGPFGAEDECEEGLDET